MRFLLEVTIQSRSNDPLHNYRLEIILSPFKTGIQEKGLVEQIPMVLKVYNRLDDSYESSDFRFSTDRDSMCSGVE